MNAKLPAFTARMGSLMLTIGLVFLVTAISPPIPGGSMSESSGYSAGPKRYMMDYLSHTTFFNQLGIRIQITTNCSFQLYLVDWEQSELENMIETWVKEQYHDLNETQVRLGAHNASVLEGFLEENPGHILLQDIIYESWSIDFFPTKETNITVILVNPYEAQARCRPTVKLASITSIVPRNQTITPSLALIVLGAVFQLASAVSTRFLR